MMSAMEQTGRVIKDWSFVEMAKELLCSRDRRMIMNVFVLRGASEQQAIAAVVAAERMRAKGL